MSHSPSPVDQTPTPHAHVWVQYVPDGAVSVTVEGTALVLKASNALQERFEILLAKQKDGALSVEETQEHQALCDLDTALSWLNRLARGAKNA